MTPNEGSDEMLKAAISSVPRRRVVSLADKLIETPHYVAVTSRGVVPHVSPDVLRKHTRIGAAYFGLEDFVEKSVPNAPLINHPHNVDRDEYGSALHNFTGLPDRLASILGPRRVPRVPCPSQSTDKAMAICTSVGFRTLQNDEYLEAADEIRPDVVVSMVDIADTDTISRKRTERMVDRTHSWFTEALSETVSDKPYAGLYASILPLENVQQQLYLADLADEEGNNGGLSGLALYDPTSAATLPANLSQHSRLCISDPSTPQDILRAISMGVDLITTPFVTAATERGIAFTFNFRPDHSSDKLPLGVDMWSTSHATSVTPLAADCSCYACIRHHRAYLHHLLQAKEMLAWTLLQIHNFHILDEFFTRVRSSIEAGTFQQDAEAFVARYEDAFLVGEGEDRGPRMRGYQMKSAGRGEDKKREKVWGRFEDSSAAASGTNSPGIGGVENDQARKVVEAVEGGQNGEVDLTADDIERLGLAEKADRS